MDHKRRDMRPPLVADARASGRELFVTTYYDGPSSPQRARLLFHSPEDAAQCAELLRNARRGRL